jgi:transposase
MRELDEGVLRTVEMKRQRKKGGGRKKIQDKQPGILSELRELVEAHTRGDPMRPLRWTSKSGAKLADELKSRRYQVGAKTVCRLLREEGYSLQSNRKRDEGRQHPDRNGQFEYIATMVKQFQERGCPVISVDAKKKELVGKYLNRGREWMPKGRPEEVSAYDFIGEGGKAVPYGIYDTTNNEGWVSVGYDSEMAQFAVRSIGRWWSQMGEWRYPEARQILIMADCGGSNSARGWLWKKKSPAMGRPDRPERGGMPFPASTP